MIEDIVLETPEDLTPILIAPKKEQQVIESELTIKNKHNLFQYQLINQHYIQLIKHDNKSNSSKALSFHVGFLQPKAKPIKRTELLNLFYVLFALNIIGFLFINNSLLIGLLLIASLSILVTLFISAQQKIVFLTESGEAPLVILLSRKSNKTKVSQFIKQLEKAIINNPLPNSPKLFAEKNKWHRKLMEEGWLSDENYQKAKQKILSQFNR
ncbi:hypothetical protein [Aliikangiella sp. IMCC44359]|uniref:hypothetical protein n=1 Tax=Aliikangiella sp. IMCC44359 TaxID=3459125 RepID=UPI00403ADDAB